MFSADYGEPDAGADGAADTDAECKAHADTFGEAYACAVRETERVPVGASQPITDACAVGESNCGSQQVANPGADGLALSAAVHEPQRETVDEPVFET